MSGELEATGDVITGGLYARAVERPTAGHGHAPAICANCGTALAGDYCHACGQGAHLHRSLGAIWHDLAHGVLHFEGKIWRTLPMLAFRPGELTRRYIAGERARFVSPLALFLFSVFLMFAVVSAIGGTLKVPEDTRTRAVAETRAELRQARSDVARLQRARDAAASARRDTRAIDATLAERRKAMNDLERVTIALGNGRVSFDTNTGWERLDKAIEKAVANPNLLFYKLQTNAYKFSWALIPLSVPFVWLLFAWRRDLHLYDHAIFVTYSLAFMSLFAIVLTLLAVAGLHEDAVEVTAAFLPAVHVYKQLKGTYRLSRSGAFLRTVLLLIFAAIVLAQFVMLLLGLGLLG